MTKDWRAQGKERLKEKQSKGKFKLVEGDNCIRVLPNKKDTAEQKFAPFVEYRVHREVGPDKRFVRCGKHFVTGEGSCWICDKLLPKLQASDSRGKRAMAEAIAPADQFAVQVAIYSSETEKFSGPFLWTPPAGGRRALSTKLLAVISSTKRDYVDPVKGYNLNIERTGTSKNDTVYGAIIPDESSSKVPSDILAKRKSFKELVPQYDEAGQKAAYFGRTEEEEPAEEQEKEAEEQTEDVDTTEEEPEEEAPRAKAKPAKKPARSSDDDMGDDTGEEEAGEGDDIGEELPEEGEESGEEVEVEEDETVAPRSKPKAKPTRRAPVEEEDELPEDVDSAEDDVDTPEEEPEEETPKPRKPAPKPAKPARRR